MIRVIVPEEGAVAVDIGVRWLLLSCMSPSSKLIAYHLEPGDYEIDLGPALDALFSPAMAAAIREEVKAA